jgi:hypothetical protein
VTQPPATSAPAPVAAPASDAPAAAPAAPAPAPQPAPVARAAIRSRPATPPRRARPVAAVVRHRTPAPAAPARTWPRPPLLLHPRPSPWKRITAVPRAFAKRTHGLPAAASSHAPGSLPFATPPADAGPWTTLLLAFAAALVVVSLGAPREHWRRRL